MPGTLKAGGNMVYDYVIGPTLTPASVAASTSAEQSFTVPGLTLQDVVAGAALNGAQTAGISIANYRVSAVNVLTVGFCNSGTTTVTPASGQYIFNMARLDVPVASLPANAA